MTDERQLEMKTLLLYQTHIGYRGGATAPSRVVEEKQQGIKVLQFTTFYYPETGAKFIAFMTIAALSDFHQNRTRKKL